MSLLHPHRILLDIRHVHVAHLAVRAERRHHVAKPPLIGGIVVGAVLLEHIPGPADLRVLPHFVSVYALDRLATKVLSHVRSLPYDSFSSTIRTCTVLNTTIAGTLLQVRSKART